MTEGPGERWQPAGRYILRQPLKSHRREFTKERKWNHKKYSVQKKAGKEEKEMAQRGRWARKRKRDKPDRTSQL